MKSSVSAFSNDNAFLFRFFYPIGALRDEAGVGLHEVDFRFEASPDNFKPCPFHDSRAGSLMNVSALKTVREDWSDVLGLIRFLGNRVAPIPVRGSGPTDWLATFWLVNGAVMMTPMFLILRRGKDRPIPRHLASAFKIALDVPTTIDLMLLFDLSSSQTVDEAAASVFDFANEKKIFLNAGYACAGSRAMITETLLAGLSPVTANCDAAAFLSDWSSFNSFLANMLTVYVLSLWSQYLTSYCASCAAPDRPTQCASSAYDRRNAVASESISLQGTRSIDIQASRYCRALERLGGSDAFCALWQALPAFRAAFDHATHANVREALDKAQTLAADIHQRIDQSFPEFEALRSRMRYTEAAGIEG